MPAVKRLLQSISFMNEAEVDNANSGKRLRCRIGFGLFALLLNFFPFIAQCQQQDVFNVGFSSALFLEVNENDAMASVRVWSHAFVEERNIQAKLNTYIFSDPFEIREAVKNGKVDCISITAMEYMQLRDLLANDLVIAGVTAGSITDEYLLLVNQESNIEKPSDLRGGSIIMLNSVRASLAKVWLDTLLVKEAQESSAGFFNKIESNSKIAKTALSVFFGQTDACVITRRGFDTMVELNPQMGQKLKIIAASPAVVPSIFCFRKDYGGPLLKQILNEIVRWHLSPAGKQSLTIFQTDSLRIESAECMKSAVDLLTEHNPLSVDSNISMVAETSRSASTKEKN